MIVTLTIDNDTALGGSCGCRLLLNALEHYEDYLHSQIDAGYSEYVDELATLRRVMVDYLDGLVSSVENAQRSEISHNADGGQVV